MSSGTTYKLQHQKAAKTKISSKLRATISHLTTPSNLPKTHLNKAGFLALTLLCALFLTMPAITPAKAQETPAPAKKSEIIDRAYFFKQFRKQFYPIKEAQSYLVDRYERLFDYWDGQHQLKDLRWLAYILATTYHETGREIKAVRECYGKTDQASIDCVTRLYRRGRIKRNYATIDKKTGKAYFGRGHVQLTWDFNYKRMGKELGLEDKVYTNPDLALHPDTSVAIMAEGMIKGIFTGKRLSNYFNSSVTNWGGARRIINGLDKYKQIGAYGRKFHASLRMIPSAQPTNPDDTDSDSDTPDIADCNGETIAQSCLTTLKAELALATGKYTDMNNRYQQALAENVALIERNKKLTAELEELKKDQPELIANYTKLKSENADLTKRFDDLTKENQTSSSENIRLTSLNQELQTKLNDALITGSTGTDSELLKKRLEEVEAAKIELKQKLINVKASEEKLAIEAAEIAAAKLKIEDQTTDIEISRNALQTREANLLEDQAILDRQEKALAEQAQQLELTEERLKRFKEDLAVEKQNLEDYYSKNWFTRMWEKTSSWRSK